MNKSTQTKGRAGSAKTPAKTSGRAARSTKPATKAKAPTAKREMRSATSGSKTTRGQTARGAPKPHTKPARADESAIRKNRTQQEILAAAANRTLIGDGERMPQTVAAQLMDNVAHECIRHLRPRGSGKCTLPGFNVILERKTKPATKARVGYNPQTREKMDVPAKPARTVLKARVGKRLLDSIGLAAN